MFEIKRDSRQPFVDCLKCTFVADNISSTRLIYVYPIILWAAVGHAVRAAPFSQIITRIHTAIALQKKRALSGPLSLKLDLVTQLNDDDWCVISLAGSQLKDTSVSAWTSLKALLLIKDLGYNFFVSKSSNRKTA